MAKIDTTRIEGYESMTPEQKLAALESFEYEDNVAEVERYKNAATKANSEAAEWKRKHNALLSEDEQKKTAAEEERATLQARVEELEKRERVSALKAKLLGLGYDEKLADETAAAYAEGDTDKVFANQKKHLDTVKKDLRSEILGETPKPGGGHGKAQTAEDIMNIKDGSERQAAIAANMEMFEN